ncbi:DNA-binding protein [archaeon]|nr:MAG: DNA-binding protein [archaeon]
MKISDIKVGMNDINIQAKVADISAPRDVQTRYGPRTVADITLEDESGQISLSLWGEAIKSVSVGDNVTVSGGYVTQFRDKLQLNIPKAGKLQVE